MTTLYELAAQYKADLEKLSDLDLPEETVRDTLEGMTGDLETKAQNVAAFIRNLETTAEAIKQAEADMAKRRKAIEARTERLKTYTLEAMTANGIERIVSPYFALTVAKNPPSVDIYDIKQVPEQFMRQPEPPPPSPDKKTIMAKLKEGEEIAGCRLNQGVRLQIK
jgi:hypothetical protein